MSAVSTMDLPRTETADCPQCGATLNMGHIVITTPRTGLGKPTRQHIEAHCPHCKIVASRDRQLIGGVWSWIGEVKVTPQSEMTAKQHRKRADLEHAIHYAPDDEFSGDEEGNCDSNGQA